MIHLEVIYQLLGIQDSTDMLINFIPAMTIALFLSDMMLCLIISKCVCWSKTNPEPTFEKITHVMFGSEKHGFGL